MHLDVCNYFVTNARVNAEGLGVSPTVGSSVSLMSPDTVSRYDKPGG